MSGARVGRKPARARREVRAASEVAEAPGGGVALYAPEGEAVRLEVRLERETVWLSQADMGVLFGRDQSVISRHLRNVFRDGELPGAGNMQKVHVPASDKPVTLYSLDAILSVGYRVNSKRGTQFRVWATQVLREHLLRGYTVNQRRLDELNQGVRLIAAAAEREDLSGDEAKALLRVVGMYSFALDLLDDYDHQRVAPAPAGSRAIHPLTAEESLRIVGQLRDRFGAGELFGRLRGGGLESALGAVFQTFEGRELYPSLEEKAANLLYFVVKNHPFVDGNKRIGAALFLWFLERNRGLFGVAGARRIADAALVALTLLIAESRAAERETVVRIVVHLLHESPRRPN